jgi:hypothetical protein
MTLNFIKWRDWSFWGAAAVLAAAVLSAVTVAASAQKADLAPIRINEQSVPDRAQFCTKSHVQQRVGQPIATSRRSPHPVHAALLIVNGRTGSGTLQSWAAEFFSHLATDPLQIAANMARYLPNNFRILDIKVSQCDPIEFPNSPYFDNLMELHRVNFGFSIEAKYNLLMIYYPLKGCSETDEICNRMLRDDMAFAGPARPEVRLRIEEAPPRAPSIPERNYPKPHYKIIPPASEILPGQSVVAFENATCSNQGNWLLTYQGTVVSTSPEEVQVFVNKRTGLYNYVGESGPGGEKIWDKGYLCAPRREFCYGDVDFDAWNGQIAKGSPVPFPRDSIAVVDAGAGDPVPVFKHFLTRECSMKPANPVSAGAENPAPEKAGPDAPPARAETAATSKAPAATAPATNAPTTAPAPAAAPTTVPATAPAPARKPE